MPKRLNILLVEDSADDAQLLLSQLEEIGYDVRWLRVETEPEFLAALSPPPELILSDYSLPCFSGLRAIELLRQQGLDIPFILISGTVGEEVAVEAMKRGASDYLLKDRLGRLGSAVARALLEGRAKADRHQLESEVRMLERAVSEVAEQERARMARDLHDGLGQQLSGLVFLTNGLERELLAAQAPQATIATRLSQELVIAARQARSLAHNLYALTTRPEGLALGLEDLADRVSRDCGIECTFAVDASLTVPNQATASHLYRIAQEAVQNALKHSQATRIDLELIQRGQMLELRIRDNGLGFPQQRPAPGLGMQTMEQRARLMGGALQLWNQTTGGVEVVCAVPNSSIQSTDPERRTPLLL